MSKLNKFLLIQFYLNHILQNLYLIYLPSSQIIVYINGMLESILKSIAKIKSKDQIDLIKYDDDLLKILTRLNGGYRINFRPRGNV